MAAAYVFGLLLVVTLVQGVPFSAEPGIIEDIRAADVGSGSRIVAGWNAEPGQIPHQASVRMVNTAGSVSSCGGSLIHHQWVLTAAHCLANRLTFVVRFGLTNLTRPDVIVETTRKFIHPKYDEIRAGVQTDDIALLGLENYIEYTDNIQPIRVMSRAQKNFDFTGYRMVVSGFGRTDDPWNGGATSEVLRWVYQRGISMADCLGWYVNSAVIREETLCVQYYNNTSQSSCQGDSGGPLTFIDNDGELTQIGVVSFGSTAGCNTPWPSGYVRPGHYHDWITEVSEGIDLDWDSDAIAPARIEEAHDKVIVVE